MKFSGVTIFLLIFAYVIQQQRYCAACDTLVLRTLALLHWFILMSLALAAGRAKTTKNDTKILGNPHFEFNHFAMPPGTFY